MNKTPITGERCDLATDLQRFSKTSPIKGRVENLIKKFEKLANTERNEESPKIKDRVQFPKDSSKIAQYAGKIFHSYEESDYAAMPVGDSDFVSPKTGPDSSDSPGRAEKNSMVKNGSESVKLEAKSTKSNDLTDSDSASFPQGEIAGTDIDITYGFMDISNKKTKETIKSKENYEKTPNLKNGMVKAKIYFLNNKEKFEKIFNENPEVQIIKLKKSETGGIAGFRIIKNNDDTLKYIIKVDAKPIGEGSFKKVLRVINNIGEELAFIKPKSKSAPLEKSEIQNVLEFANTEGVVGAHRVLNMGSGEQTLIMKYYNGKGLKNLLEQVNKGQRRLSLNEKMTILQGALTGLSNMHKKNYGHYDIWSDNIMIKLEGGKVKEAALGDLGIASNKGPFKVRFDHAPPELYKWQNEDAKGSFGKDFDPKKWDVWAMGCVMYEIIQGKPLEHIQYYIDNGLKFMKEDRQYNVYGPLVRGVNIEEPQEKNSIDHLMWSMLKTDPNKRITAKEALERLQIILASGANHPIYLGSGKTRA